MVAMLDTMTDEQWLSPSRCDGWTARDVVAHLVDVNAFWHVSIAAGLAGSPSWFLEGFDPAATPPLLVARMSALDARQVFDEFVVTSDALLEIVTDLTDEEWSTIAESPAGHVPIRLVVQHALWDCWVHERDIAVPLGIAPASEVDELGSCLRYAAVIGPVLGLGLGTTPATIVAVEATDPAMRFVVEINESVSLRDEEAAADVACLRGDALAMVEALSLRSPMASSSRSSGRVCCGPSSGRVRRRPRCDDRGVTGSRGRVVNRRFHDRSAPRTCIFRRRVATGAPNDAHSR